LMAVFMDARNQCGHDTRGSEFLRTGSLHKAAASSGLS
jgi:hypothetical protein